jgi:outer membrane protein, adhesin transport system
MKIRLISLSFLIFLVLAPAVGQKVYGLKDCISIGLEKNFSILIARNSETISKNNYTLGNAGYLPSLDLSGRYGGTLTNSVQNPVSGDQTETKGVSNKGVSNTSGTAGLNLGWTIFNGFNVQTTYKKLNELKELGTLNTQLSAENLIAEIIAGYYNYIDQVEALNNAKYAATLSKERLRIDEERYLLGASSKLQVLQSRVYLNADSSSLSKQNQIVRNAIVKLNELMALDNLGTEFVSEDTAIMVNPSLLYEKLLEETLSGNTSLNIASKNKIVSEFDYKLVVSRSYPYLNLTSGYTYNYNTYGSGSNKSQITNGMNYGLTLGLNIFDGFNQRRSIRNSSIDVKNKELRYLEIEQGIRADLLMLYNAYSNNLQLIRLEEQNLETATENLDIALERYKLGSLSGLDLREVQMSLLDAKARLLAIQYQTKLAEISLKLISGRIMEYYQ